MANSDGHLNAVLEKLEDCRRILAEGRTRETADLVSIAILDLRMKLGQVGGSELRALCDEMLQNLPPEPQRREIGLGLPGGPGLRLVK